MSGLWSTHAPTSRPYSTVGVYSSVNFSYFTVTGQGIGLDYRDTEWLALNLLELTPKKDVLFITGDWNAKVGSQETPGVTGNLALEYRMKQGKG